MGARSVDRSWLPVEDGSSNDTQSAMIKGISYQSWTLKRTEFKGGAYRDLLGFNRCDIGCLLDGGCGWMTPTSNLRRSPLIFVLSRTITGAQMHAPKNRSSQSWGFERNLSKKQTFQKASSLC